MRAEPIECSAPALPHAVVAGIEGLLIGDQRIVSLVLPPGSSSKVKVVSSSSGHVGLIGCRVMPPASSENEFTKTSRSGAVISR
jgi:hypothetical protein